MADLNECVALEVNGEEVSLYEVLILAKLNGTLKFISDGLEAALIQQAAKERGIEVSDEELQQAADDFRTSNELYDAEATDAWLETRKLSYQDWEYSIEYRVIARKLRDQITDPLVDQRFAEQRLAFEKAAVSRLVVADEGVARELRAQIIEDGADFHALAREYSIHADTRPAGGYAGEVQRSEMEPAMESAVFGGQPGKVVGPIKTDDGWELIKIERMLPAELDDAMRETIKTQIFKEWLDERRKKARINIPLLEPGEEANPTETDLDG